MLNKKKIGIYQIDLDSKLGGENYVQVFKGQCTTNSEIVVIKCYDKIKLLKSKQKTKQYLQSAINHEINNLMKMNSPNTIAFRDYCYSKNHVYIVTEYANGGTLANILNKKGKFNEQLTMNCLKQILNGFLELIKFGIVHRDIKLANIFIHNGMLKIGDFGFSVRKFRPGSLTMMKSKVGTPGYMPPQILNSQIYSYKCDIWSLGVMIYQMIVGKLPYEANFIKGDFSPLYNKIKNTPLQFPITISPKLKDFIRGCLQFYQKDRFNWEKIYTHPIFEGYFIQSYKSIKSKSQNINYLMKNFGDIFHLYGIDIQKEIGFIKKKKLSIEEFKLFLRYLNCNISEQQKNQMTDLLRKQQTVNLTQFYHLLQKYGCTINRIEQNSSNDHNNQKFRLVYDLIFKINEQNKIDISNIFPINKKSLSIQQFVKGIQKIAPEIPEYIIPQLYEQYFKVSINESISIQNCIQLINYMCAQQMDIEMQK